MPSLSSRIAAATAAARTARPESDALRELEQETAWMIAAERSPTRCECCNAPNSTTRGRLCADCRNDLQREGT